MREAYPPHVLKAGGGTGCVGAAKEILQACRDAGVNFFDNAEVYASGVAEKVMGQAIKVLHSPLLHLLCLGSPSRRGTR